MTICDHCREHVSRRNMVKGDNVTHLVNIPKSTLKQESLDTLASIFRMAQEGTMVCGDCIKLCNMKDDSCKDGDYHALNVYKNRMASDKATMKDILEEMDRRINLKEAHEELSKMRK